jgi:hypothetical protein
MMNALGRRTFVLKNHWAAIGAGITGAVAAFFIPRFASLGRASPYNNYYDLRNAPESQYS